MRREISLREDFPGGSAVPTFRQTNAIEKCGTLTWWPNRPVVALDLHRFAPAPRGDLPQAFDGLRAAADRVRQPSRTVATVDHNIPTEPRGQPITDPIAAKQIQALQANCQEFGIHLLTWIRRIRESCTSSVPNWLTQRV